MTKPDPVARLEAANTEAVRLLAKLDAAAQRASEWLPEAHGVLKDIRAERAAVRDDIETRISGLVHSMVHSAGEELRRVVTAAINSDVDRIHKRFTALERHLLGDRNDPDNSVDGVLQQAIDRAVDLKLANTGGGES